jgi:predicted ATPase
MHLSFCLAASLYVLTGASSVGKTSIIKELEKQGESVIHEAATDWISSKLQMGIHEFWKEEDFGYNILKLQLEREAPFLSCGGRVFIDRGIFDGYAYVMPLSLAGTKTLSAINEALEEIDLNKRYAAVFFILPYKGKDFSPTKTDVRRENLKEVEELQVALYAIYCRHKNFIIVPGDLSVEERSAIILEHVNNLEQKR